MITVRQQGNAIIAVVFGEFQLADYRELEQAIDDSRMASGAGAMPVDLLVDLRAMATYTLDVLWEDLRYTRQHAQDFGRIAVVVGSELAGWASWLAQAFVDAQFEAFQDYPAALDWLNVTPIHHTIVSAELLQTFHDEWVVFDCRHNLADRDAGRQAYEAGHIPGAHFLHLDFDLAAEPSGSNGRHPLPDPEALAQRLGVLGVGKATQVVVYDDAGGAFAGRLWWMLRWLGHDAVAVLDGGYPQWVAQGWPVESGADARAQGLPVPPELGKAPLAGLPIVLQHDSWVPVETVLRNLETSECLLIDARAPDRFRGENETIDPVGGHIPGAVNRFFKDNLDASGCFKAPAVLRAEFETLLKGYPPAKVISQCGSGVTACHNLLALEIAGLSGARLYPGSWSEWCANPARPVAR